MTSISGVQGTNGAAGQSFDSLDPNAHLNAQDIDFHRPVESTILDEYNAATKDVFNLTLGTNGFSVAINKNFSQTESGNYWTIDGEGLAKEIMRLQKQIMYAQFVRNMLIHQMETVSMISKVLMGDSTSKHVDGGLDATEKLYDQSYTLIKNTLDAVIEQVQTNNTAVMNKELNRVHDIRYRYHDTPGMDNEVGRAIIEFFANTLTGGQLDKEYQKNKLDVYVQASKAIKEVNDQMLAFHEAMLNTGLYIKFLGDPSSGQTHPEVDTNLQNQIDRIKEALESPLTQKDVDGKAVSAKTRDLEDRDSVINRVIGSNGQAQDFFDIDNSKLANARKQLTQLQQGIRYITMMQMRFNEFASIILESLLGINRQDSVTTSLVTSATDFKVGMQNTSFDNYVSTLKVLKDTYNEGINTAVEYRKLAVAQPWQILSKVLQVVAILGTVFVAGLPSTMIFGSLGVIGVGIDVGVQLWVAKNTRQVPDPVTVIGSSEELEKYLALIYFMGAQPVSEQPLSTNTTSNGVPFSDVFSKLNKKDREMAALFRDMGQTTDKGSDSWIYSGDGRKFVNNVKIAELRERLVNIQSVERAIYALLMTMMQMERNIITTVGGLSTPAYVMQTTAFIDAKIDVINNGFNWLLDELTDLQTRYLKEQAMRNQIRQLEIRLATQMAFQVTALAVSSALGAAARAAGAGTNRVARLNAISKSVGFLGASSGSAVAGLLQYTDLNPYNITRASMPLTAERLAWIKRLSRTSAGLGSDTGSALDSEEHPLSTADSIQEDIDRREEAILARFYDPKNALASSGSNFWDKNYQVVNYQKYAEALSELRDLWILRQAIAMLTREMLRLTKIAASTIAGGLPLTTAAGDQIGKVISAKNGLAMQQLTESINYVSRIKDIANAKVNAQIDIIQQSIALGMNSILAGLSLFHPNFVAGIAALISGSSGLPAIVIKSRQAENQYGQTGNLDIDRLPDSKSSESTTTDTARFGDANLTDDEKQIFKALSESVIREGVGGKWAVNDANLIHALRRLDQYFTNRAKMAEVRNRMIAMQTKLINQIAGLSANIINLESTVIAELAKTHKQILQWQFQNVKEKVARHNQIIDARREMVAAIFNAAILAIANTGKGLSKINEHRPLDPDVGSNATARALGSAQESIGRTIQDLTDWWAALVARNPLLKIIDFPLRKLLDLMSWVADNFIYNDSVLRQFASLIAFGIAQEYEHNDANKVSEGKDTGTQLDAANQQVAPTSEKATGKGLAGFIGSSKLAVRTMQITDKEAAYEMQKRDQSFELIRSLANVVRNFVEDNAGAKLFYPGIINAIFRIMVLGNISTRAAVKYERGRDAILAESAQDTDLFIRGMHQNPASDVIAQKHADGQKIYLQHIEALIALQTESFERSKTYSASDAKELDTELRDLESQRIKAERHGDFTEVSHLQRLIEIARQNKKTLEDLKGLAEGLTKLTKVTARDLKQDPLKLKQVIENTKKIDDYNKKYDEYLKVIRDQRSRLAQEDVSDTLMNFKEERLKQRKALVTAQNTMVRLMAKTALVSDAYLKKDVTTSSFAKILSALNPEIRKVLVADVLAMASLPQSAFLVRHLAALMKPDELAGILAGTDPVIAGKAIVEMTKLSDPTKTRKALADIMTAWDPTAKGADPQLHTKGFLTSEGRLTPNTIRFIATGTLKDELKKASFDDKTAEEAEKTLKGVSDKQGQGVKLAQYLQIENNLNAIQTFFHRNGSTAEAAQMGRFLARGQKESNFDATRGRILSYATKPGVELEKRLESLAHERFARIRRGDAMSDAFLDEAAILSHQTILSPVQSIADVVNHIPLLNAQESIYAFLYDQYHSGSVAKVDYAANQTDTNVTAWQRLSRQTTEMNATKFTQFVGQVFQSNTLSPQKRAQLTQEWIKADKAGFAKMMMTHGATNSAQKLAEALPYFGTNTLQTVFTIVQEIQRLQTSIWINALGRQFLKAFLGTQTGSGSVSDILAREIANADDGNREKAVGLYLFIQTMLGAPTVLHPNRSRLWGDIRTRDTETKTRFEHAVAHQFTLANDDVTLTQFLIFLASAQGNAKLVHNRLTRLIDPVDHLAPSLLRTTGHNRQVQSLLNSAYQDANSKDEHHQLIREVIFTGNNPGEVRAILSSSLGTINQKDREKIRASVALAAHAKFMDTQSLDLLANSIQKPDHGSKVDVHGGWAEESPLDILEQDLRAI